MGTKTITPRTNNDGQIGSDSKYWNKGYFNELHTNNLYTSATGLTANTITVTDGGIVFEGSGVDDFETTLAVTNPTADRTITFPDATGTVALTSDIPAATTVGWHGSATRIKILHSDFIADDGGRPYMIDDSGVGSEELFGETHATLFAYATIAIPAGYQATELLIYGDGARAVEVWEHQINSKTGVSKGTGSVDTAITAATTPAFTAVSSSTTNYLFIQVAQQAGDEIHGGYITITTI
mgnify:CR=1 FL=1